MSIFKGCATALVTPFTKDGIDYESFERLIEFQISKNINALVVLGTTGEASTLSYEEREAVVGFAVSKIKGRVPVIVGSGSNNTENAIRLSKSAETLGADGLLVVTPYYNKCTQNGLVAYYKTIADSVGIPLIAYNVPGRTGLDLLPATFAKMCKHKNIVAIKEASGKMEQICETIRLSQGRAEVYSGDDSIVVPVMSVGGIGVICTSSNVAPALFSKMTELALSGDFKAAAELQLKALPLIKALFSEVNPIPVKTATKLLGLTNGKVRPPLTDMEEANAARLSRVLDELLQD